jgi:hypothetical protein
MLNIQIQMLILILQLVASKKMALKLDKKSILISEWVFESQLRLDFSYERIAFREERLEEVKALKEERLNALQNRTRKTP